jgi:predicted Zn-dependent protease
VAAYPYSGSLVARLAQQYFNDGQAWRARVVIQQYSKLFPEDPTVRDALKQFDSQGNSTGSLSAPSPNNPSIWPSK